MRLGTMLGNDGQSTLKKAVERNAKFEAKKEKQRRDAEKNRKRQRGEIIRYGRDDR